MILLNIPFRVFGLVAVLVLLYLLATLSRRLGAVTKMKPHYRWFYVAMAGVVVSIAAALLRQTSALADPDLFQAAYQLPRLLAGVISLVVAYRYWGWLFRERIK